MRSWIWLRALAVVLAVSGLTVVVSMMAVVSLVRAGTVAVERS